MSCCRAVPSIWLRHGRDQDWSADDLFAAQQWANDEHYPGGLAAGTLAARFADRTPIELAERDKLCAAVVQYARQLNSDACIAGDMLTDNLLAAHHRRAIRKALVELGYLDITRTRQWLES